MATSAKPTPSAEPLAGAALLMGVVAVAFLAGTCTALEEVGLPPVDVSNVTVKNDLATTLIVTIITNLTVAGEPLAVSSSSFALGPGQSRQVPISLAKNALPGQFYVIYGVHNRSYKFPINLEDVLLGDSGDVTGEVTNTVSSPCPAGNPHPPAIYVTLTTPTGLGDQASCVEPIST